jgi:hypothetical protein
MDRKKFRKIRCDGENWINLAQDGDVWRAAINTGYIKAGHFLGSSATVSLSRKTMLN